MSKYICAAVAAEVIAEKHGIPLGDLVDTFSDIPAADDACRDCVYARPIKKLKYQHSCQYRNGPNCNLN